MEAINHEYYVSLEVAKLLKEAGFDWKVNHYYFTQNGKTEAKSDFRHPAQNYNESMATMDSKSFEFEVCSRPTLDVAQRWLREVMKIEIFVEPFVGFYKYMVEELSEDGIYDYGRSESYEEAQEAGIKKALEIILEK